MAKRPGQAGKWGVRFRLSRRFRPARNRGGRGRLCSPPPLPRVAWSLLSLLVNMDAIDTLLKQVLDGTTTRNRALANNIANATTAGYRRRDVDFVSELHAALQSENPNAVAEWKPKLDTARREIPIRLEKEFALMAENQLLYQTSAEALARRYMRLKAAISGKVL